MTSKFSHKLLDYFSGFYDSEGKPKFLATYIF